MNKKVLMPIWVAFFAFFGLGAMLMTTSCEQDPCGQLNCQNGSSCSDGHCICPEGFTGSECQYTQASYFVGKYVGRYVCNQNPEVIDTVEIKEVEYPDRVVVIMGMGNTSILEFFGYARLPEVQFGDQSTSESKVHPSLRVDGNQMTAYLETYSYATGEKSICKFVGVKIEEVVE